jgi:hypothetical protein
MQGAHIWIDGWMVVDNGGLHGATLNTGVVTLGAGYHYFKADWFVNTVGLVLCSFPPPEMWL